MNEYDAGAGDRTRRPLVVADLRPLLGFFSRLPVGASASLEAVVDAFPLVPVVGWMTGAVGAVACLLLAPLLPAAALGAILLTLVVGLTGLNQTDGLLDLGDGLMVHGDAEKRLQGRHDHSAGVGAVGAVLFTYLLAYGALVGIVQTLAVGSGVLGGRPDWFAEDAFRAAAAVAAAEILCRVPYLLLSVNARASHGGLGDAFVRGFRVRHLVVGLVAATPGVALSAWLGWLPALLAAAAAVGVGLGLRRTAERLLGGVGGDVMGASQEVARTAVLLALCLGLGLERLL